MKWKHFWFGIRDADLELMRKRLEHILDIQMKGVASDAYGGDLFIYRSEDVPELRLFQNWNAHEQEWNRPRFDDFDLLISLDRLMESEAI